MSPSLLWTLLAGCAGPVTDTGRGPGPADLERCVTTDLLLAADFDHPDRPNLATITARVPRTQDPDEAWIRYREGPFDHEVDLDLEARVERGRLRWDHPFPSGAEVELTLELGEGEDRRCQTLALDVPVVDETIFPLHVSDWTYEAYPRPVVTTASVVVAHADGERIEHVLLLDHAGRYLWSHPVYAPRAFAVPDGVLLLSDTTEEGDDDAQVLTLIRWDGRVEEQGLVVEDYHHDYVVPEDQGTVYTLALEDLEVSEEICTRKPVVGDVILQVDAASSVDLWRTSEDYPADYDNCNAITSRSVSYLNGLGYHDGILAASSSPAHGTGASGLVVGYRDEPAEEAWRFHYLSVSDEESDVALTYEAGCQGDSGETQALLKPHGVVCEDTLTAGGGRQLNCFVHNRRGPEECDSLEWLQIDVDDDGLSAVCLDSTRPTSVAADDTCGNSAQHGNVDWLDGRVDDPEGLFAVQFSPAGGYTVGVRARLEAGTSELVEAFRVFDPHADWLDLDAQDGATCLDSAPSCTADGRFVSARPGLGDRWAAWD